MRWCIVYRQRGLTTEIIVTSNATTAEDVKKEFLDWYMSDIEIIRVYEYI